MWTRLFAFASLLALATAPTQSSADDPAPLPDLDTVRANVKAAAGVEPASERRTIAFVLDGLPGRRVLERSGDDYVETTDYGPLHRAAGRIGDRRWYQNENGETIVVSADPGKAAPDAFKTTLRRDGPDTLVLESVDAKGYGTREFVNANTWLVQRVETISAGGTSVTAYDDYRSSGGRTMAYHWSVRDGHPENDADYRVESETATPVPAEDLAIPPARKALVEFPPDTTSVVLPAHTAMDRFVVRLDFGNGRSANFLLDTGASGIIIDDDAADRLGLTAYGAISNGVNAGRYVSRTVVAPAIAIGDLKMHDVVMHTIPHSGAEHANDGSPVVGLLGFDFIDALALEFDYAKGTVVATRDDAFAPPQTSDTYSLDVRLGTGQPMTDVRVNGALGERFVLDTGAYGSLLIDDYFVRRYPDALVDERPVAGQAMRYYGVGGLFSTQPYQIASLQLGQDVHFKDFTVYRVTSDASYGGNTDGLLGSELLKYFTMYTDYPRGKVYLQTNDIGRTALGTPSKG